MSSIEIVHNGTFDYGFVEALDDDNREEAIDTFWSLYVRDEKGLAYCVGDFSSEEAANRIVELLKAALTDSE